MSKWHIIGNHVFRLIYRHHSVSGGNETNDITVAPENAIEMDDDLTQDPDKTTSKTIIVEDKLIFFCIKL